MTGIFGDEERLGTEQALLSVGSVINELSQNCSASAPYIAEFAFRMGGVGAQAKMTVQQIMGFAAVLDSNNQKLEASSTALSQVIVRIYQDPAKYARVAGIEVEKFSQMVKEDMNGALIYFLETLNKAGNMDVLSPMFKDMGENGSRAISALSTLANNIDAVKSQQEVANIAFAEAISIDKEFEVQNNTVQAGLDKAKKRVNELAVELGQKLQPIMRYVISSSTMFLRALSALIDFFIKYKTEIVTATAAIAAYNLIMLVYNARTILATKLTALFHATLALMKGVIPAVRLLLVPLINTIQYFTNGLQVNYAMQLRWRNAMAAMKLTNWVGLIVAAAAAVYLLAKRFSESTTAAERAKKMYDEIEREAKESTATQIKLLDELYKRTQDATLSLEERTKAVERLRTIYPDYFGDLTNEAILAGQAAKAYEDLRNAILESARAKGREKRIADLEAEIQEIKAEYEKEAMPWIERKFKAMGKHLIDPENLQYDPDYRMAQWSLNVIDAQYKPRIEEKQKQQQKLADLNADYQLNQDSRDSSGNGGSSCDSGNSGNLGSGSPTSESSPDRFAAEKVWREREEALNRIAYATGEKDYVAYTNRMDEIAVEFYQKQLLHTDLSENERLSIQAQYAEAAKKQQEHFNAQSIDAENAAYNEKIANLKQHYINGEIDKATYDLKIEEAEIEHQQTLVNLAVEGSKERLQAEARLSDLLIAQMQRRQAETQKLEQTYAKMKSEYFGDNPQEAQAKYDADLAALDVAYQRELAAAGNNADEKLRIEEAYQKAKLLLQKKYGKLAEKDNRNRVERMTDDIVEWLDSDGGKAVTGTIDTLVSGMSAIFSQLSSMMQADLQIQTAEINKRYDAEISRAEGNSYQVAKLEKEKEAAIAKAKNEANRKMFAMQVIQAVAQTAQNAISAYGSAAAIPLVGYILAPIAAAMAITAGMLQVAAIKKQQQASEAQGYSEGGFTPDGDKDKAVGIVHAGEWVASQKLTRNPQVRPLLEALDYAQKNNTIGSIRMADVSRSVTAPMLTASHTAQSVQPNVVVNVPSNSSDNSELTNTISRLADRLNEPFVTVNTVTGDHGIQKAQDEYDRLLKNKSPKSKR